MSFAFPKRRTLLLIGVPVGVLLTIALAIGAVWSFRVVKIGGIIPGYAIWLAAALGILLFVAAMFNARVARRLSYTTRRLFSVAKLIGVCVLLIALLGIVVRLSSHSEGVTILAFDDETKDAKYNGKAIADSLQVELLRIQQILALRREGIDSDRLKSTPFRQENERLSDSLKEIGTVGAGEAKISIGALLLACKRFWPLGDSGKVITGGIQRFGQTIRITARVESKNEMHGYEVTRVPKAEDEILEMVYQLAFKIAMDLQDPEHPISAQTSEGLQEFTEALACYDRFRSTGNMADLDSAKQRCLNVFLYENGYAKLFALLTNIGISYYEVKDYQSATEVFEKAASLEPNLADAMNNLGLALARLQRIEEAREKFTKARSLSGDTPYAQALYDTNLGDAQFYARRFDDAERSYRDAIAKQSDLAIAHLGLASVLVAKGETGSAKEQIEKAMALDPMSPTPRLRLGDLFQTIAKYDEARAEYLTAIKLEAENAEAYNALGTIALQFGDLETAITNFHLSIDFAPHYNSPHIGLGVALRIKGDADGAKREFQRATELDRLDPDPHSALGELLLYTGELDAAASAFQRAVELAPLSERCHLNFGDLFRIQGKFAEAKHEYEMAERASAKSWSVRLAFGSWHMDQGDYEAAKMEYLKAAEIAPRDPYPIMRLGDLYCAKGEIDASKEAYKRVLNLAPQLAEGHYGLGQTLYNAGDYKSANSEYSVAIQKAPGWADPYVGRGNAYYAMSNFEGAAADYRRAIEISPLAPAAHADLGDVYCRQQQYDKAIEEYTTAIKNDARNNYAHRQLGVVLLMTEKLQDAIGHCETAYALAPTDYGAGLMMGTVASLTNQSKKAEQIWTQVLEKGRGSAVEEKLDRALILSLLHKDKEALEFFQKEIPSLSNQPAGLLLERRELFNIPLLTKSTRFLSCRQLLADVTINTANTISGKDVGKTGDQTKPVRSAPQPSRN